jgi:hypothetical protein
MVNIAFSLNVQVDGGPQILVSEKKSVEAYDKIEVTIDPGADGLVVEIQPGAGNQVSFLLIKSNLYSENDPDPNKTQNRLTYVVSNGSQDSPNKIELDKPHLFLGKGAVSVFGLAPKILKFNSTYKESPSNPNKATIEILVGRDATPATPATP